MPTLNWIGKDAVVKHHKDVPLRLLEPVPALSSGDAGSGSRIVEYKGADRWTDAADDRLIGGLWQKLSGGTCQFVKVKDKQWDAIEPLLA